MLVKPRYFEDYVVGESRKSFGRTIGETDFIIHAGHSGDFFPHHVDSEFAKGTQFKRRIAHGTMVLTIGIGLTATEINPHSFSYGYDRVRFVKPAFIGDTIHTVTTISATEPDEKRPGMGRVVEKCEVRNQEDALLMVCEHLYLVEMRDVS